MGRRKCVIDYTRTDCIARKYLNRKEKRKHLEREKNMSKIDIMEQELQAVKSELKKRQEEFLWFT